MHGDELDAEIVELTERRREVAKVATEAIEASDDHHVDVAMATGAEERIEGGPAAERTTDALVAVLGHQLPAPPLDGLATRLLLDRQ